jgi:hypothetical protein
MTARTLSSAGLRLLAHHDLDGHGDGMQVLRQGPVLYLGHTGTSGMGTSILDALTPGTLSWPPSGRRRRTRTPTRCRWPTGSCW